jgi:hypothetical protein
MAPGQYAFGKTFWQRVKDDPEMKADFDAFMKAPRRGAQTQLWHERYPLAPKLGNEKLRTDEDAVLMVDVGGGVGGQVAAFRKAYADLPGRCILQDLPDTMKGIKAPLEGVEVMPYNFFEAQPVKGEHPTRLRWDAKANLAALGARIYLFRSVCHDWPDADCRRLLGNTVEAMDPQYSRLVIDEWTLPDTHVTQKAANMDLTMWLLYGASERTREQWEKLLDETGLEIVEIFTTPGAAESIIETRRKV